MKNNIQKQSGYSSRDKINAFRNQHPKFRKYVDIVADFIEKFLVVYWVMIFLVVAIPILILYYNLRNEIRSEVAGIFGGILSLIVIPLALNHINKRKESEFKLFEDNKLLYNELSSIFIALLTAKDDKLRGQREILYEFICKNYSAMCLLFSSSFIWDIVYIYQECGFENNDDNIRYYTQKCLRKIRNQIGLKKDFYLNNAVLKMINEQTKAEKKTKTINK